MEVYQLIGGDICSILEGKKISYLLNHRIHNSEPWKECHRDQKIDWIYRGKDILLNQVQNLDNEEDTERAWKRCLGLWRDFVHKIFRIKIHPNTNPRMLQGMDKTRKILSSNCKNVIWKIACFLNFCYLWVIHSVKEYFFQWILLVLIYQLYRARRENINTTFTKTFIT